MTGCVTPLTYNVCRSALGSDPKVRPQKSLHLLMMPVESVSKVMHGLFDLACERDRPDQSVVR